MDTNTIVHAAWNRQEPDSMDFAEERLYRALRSIYFLYTSGDLSKEAATEAKERMLESYKDFRKKWAHWVTCEAAYSCLLYTSDAADD